MRLDTVDPEREMGNYLLLLLHVRVSLDRDQQVVYTYTERGHKYLKTQLNSLCHSPIILPSNFKMKSQWSNWRKWLHYHHDNHDNVSHLWVSFGRV